jgi:hypothetical protein
MFRSLRSVVVSVVAGIVVALVLVAVVVPFHVTTVTSQNNPPGYAFNQASQLADANAASTIGAPWRLVSALGVAASGPILPLVSSLPATGCQGLAGPTLWNGSRIPAWTGSMSAGITPFWQFLFVNSSGSLLPMETVNQSITVEPSLTPNSACGQALKTLDGTTLPVDLPTISAPFDSTTASQVAWNNGGQQFFTDWHSGIAFYALGPPPLYGPIFGPGWGITYTLCGLPGDAGVVAGMDVGVVKATGPPAQVLNFTATCTFNAYDIAFGSALNLSAPEGGEFVEVPMSIDVPYVNNSSQTSSLATWLSSLNLTNLSGTKEPVAAVSCSPPGFSSASCRPTGAGWFAALATGSGFWLDLFVAGSGPPGWVLPNVGMYTNDSLVVYLPPSLMSSAFTLKSLSTDSAVILSGSTTI